MVIFGADSHALRLLAGKLDEISGRLASIEGSVNGRVDAMKWTGGDADRFRSKWSSTSAPSMRDASVVLSEAASAIRGDAQRQDQVSRA